MNATAIQPAMRAASATEGVEVRSIRKQYGDFVAVSDLSFRIEPGKIYGLLGPNGAGKTSTLRMILGILEPDSGQISIFGQPLDRAHKDVFGYLPEERGLYRKMKVLEHLVFLGQLKGLTSGDATARAKDWCERFELAAWTGKKVEELSKGMQQKVQFIGAVLHDPRLVIMDEPFSGLDPANALVLKDAFIDLARKGKTVLLSTHRMDSAEKLCHSICLMNHGHAVLEGDLAQIKANYGHSNVQMRYEGDESFLREARLVESFNNYGNFVEVRLTSGADAQELLQLALSKARVNKFELMEPSLEEIFLDATGKSKCVTRG